MQSRIQELYRQRVNPSSGHGEQQSLKRREQKALAKEIAILERRYVKDQRPKEISRDLRVPVNQVYDVVRRFN